jgi:hypothetical protein
MTAKGGFINEADICRKFMEYKTDIEAKNWLLAMGYIPPKIQKILAIQIPIRINLEKAIALGVSQEKYNETIKFKKADIQIKIEITVDDVVYVENISLKKSNKSARFNQVDKRSVLTYQKIWKFDDDIAKWLRLFTGDILPKEILSHNQLTIIKDKRRLFFPEIPNDKQQKIIAFFVKNKTLIVSDILRGRGALSAEWFLVTRKNCDNTIEWLLKDVNNVCNFFSQGDVKISPKGSLKIGRITMQRKGGTPDPTSLQFKINPLALFEE